MTRAPENRGVSAKPGGAHYQGYDASSLAGEPDKRCALIGAGSRVVLVDDACERSDIGTRLEVHSHQVAPMVFAMNPLFERL